MEQTPSSDIEKALRIAGPEDFSYDGQHGSVRVTGHFAEALVDNIQQCSQNRRWFEGKEVIVLRGGSLEVCCDGVYVEGQAVRRIVHAAARQIDHQYAFNLKAIAATTVFESSRWLTAV
ncbi:hypothetical protein RBE51_20360 [Pseudomonas taiwanensis]|uniref:hypothetical protein n=1 Tax=Pseudomonas taiwanensis TaxID=470150 RepID=UPI0028E04DCF|nr:hypothetical protein [Pseudomonas taiwanensis]MDT8925148.1 hypothetical protein [Pseudomonas taiwanensis]